MSKKSEIEKEARRQKLLSEGVPEEKVEQVLAAEEFYRLPIDQRVNALLAAVNRAQRVYTETIQGLAGEMVALRQNQEAIADAFDINLRAVESHLTTLGITKEVQASVLEKVTQVFMQEKMPKDPEQKSVESEVASADSESSSLSV